MIMNINILAYLLYDLLSNDLNGKHRYSRTNITYLIALPWNVKKYFQRSYERNYFNIQIVLANFDKTKIPLEQQICLMKANDVSLKRKAMIKLKRS